MAIQNAYLQGVYEGLAKRNPEQKEFLQAVEEVLESLEPVVAAHPEYEKAGLIDADQFAAGSTDWQPVTMWQG